MKKQYIIFLFLGALLLTLGAGCVSSSDDSATSGPAGMFLSRDKGESWEAISILPAPDGIKKINSASVYRLAEDPGDPRALYWMSRGNGLFFTFDDGKTWQQSPDPFTGGFVYATAINPKDRCIIYSTNGRQVFKTIDCMRSWEEVYQEGNVEDSITDLAFDPFSPDKIYMSESNGVVLKSTDGGENWQRLDEKFSKGNIRDIEFDKNKEGLMYVATRNKGLFRSKDGGQTWDSLRSKFDKYAKGALNYRRFYVYPGESDQIYWISEYGIFTSRNAGDDWEEIKMVTPPGEVDIYGFAINPQNDQEIYYTAALKNKSTFYRSADGGKSWETRKLPSKQIPTVLRVHPEHGDWLYLGFTIPPEKK